MNTDNLIILLGLLVIYIIKTIFYGAIMALLFNLIRKVVEPHMADIIISVIIGLGIYNYIVVPLYLL